MRSDLGCGWEFLQEEKVLNNIVFLFGRLPRSKKEGHPPVLQFAPFKNVGT